MYTHIATMWWPCLYTYRSAPRNRFARAFQPLQMARSCRLHKAIGHGASQDDWGIDAEGIYQYDIQ